MRVKGGGGDSLHPRGQTEKAGGALHEAKQKKREEAVLGIRVGWR
jgi:hypothetical protein